MAKTIKIEVRLTEADRVAGVLGALTKRERALVREVAVMAGVRATMRAGARYEPAGDDFVVRDAISACLSMPDLYPALARIDQRARAVDGHREKT